MSGISDDSYATLNILKSTNYTLEKGEFYVNFTSIFKK